MGTLFDEYGEFIIEALGGMAIIIIIFIILLPNSGGDFLSQLLSLIFDSILGKSI